MLERIYLNLVLDIFSKKIGFEILIKKWLVLNILYLKNCFEYLIFFKVYFARCLHVTGHIAIYFAIDIKSS